MEYLIPILLSATISIITMNCLKRRFIRPIVMECYDWLDINETPVPEDIQYLYLSDGKDVRHCFGLNYNRKGQLVFGWDDKIATHWMPQPLPPKK